MAKLNVNKVMNWSEISRAASGKTTAIRGDKTPPKKHREMVTEIKNFFEYLNHKYFKS